MNLSTVFIGHQSWMVSLKKTNILVDPVLTKSFGTSPNLRFRVYPPRVLDLNSMPNISAVVITNEHLDHFHLDSLKLIPIGIPIIFGELMPEVCVNYAKLLGHDVHVLTTDARFEVGELTVRLYLGSDESEFWEKRVYHTYIQPITGDRGIFIQSDALVCQRFKSFVEEGQIAPPLVFISTNNAQIVPPGFKGTYDNLLLPESTMNQGHFGIQILAQVVSSYLQGLPAIPHIILSGGGYIQEPMKHPPFLLSDTQQLADLASKLALYQKIHGLYPGQKLEFSDCEQVESSEVKWITIDKKFWLELNNLHQGKVEQLRSDWFNYPIFSEHQGDSVNKKLNVVESFLEKMVAPLMMSKMGAAITTLDEYLDGPIGSERFIFQFLSSNKYPIQYSLDFNKSVFERLENVCKNPLQRYPFGVEVHLNDFYALIDGKIQIWELSTSRLRQWYLTDQPLLSPVGFLYCFFSEQVQPELTRKLYDYILSRNILSSEENIGNELSLLM